MHPTGLPPRIRGVLLLLRETARVDNPGDIGAAQRSETASARGVQAGADDTSDFLEPA